MPDDYYVSQYSGEEIDALLGGAGTGTVRYDAAQSLTDTQKTQARGNIEAAPAGFGVGEVVSDVTFIPTLAELDATEKSGLYFYYSNEAIGSFPYGQYGMVLVLSTAGVKRQYFFPRQTDSRWWVRQKTNYAETWGEWEFGKVPMDLGVEYRTTERYLGKPVYVKAVDCGNLPAPGSTKNVSHGISGCLPIMVTAQMSNSNTIPWLGKFTVGADNTNIVLYSPADASDFSGLTAMAILKYTKTTD